MVVVPHDPGPLMFASLLLGAVAGRVHDLVGEVRRRPLSQDLVRPYAADADELTIYALSFKNL